MLITLVCSIEWQLNECSIRVVKQGAAWQLSDGHAISFCNLLGLQLAVATWSSLWIACLIQVHIHYERFIRVVEWRPSSRYPV